MKVSGCEPDIICIADYAYALFSATEALNAECAKLHSITSHSNICMVIFFSEKLALAGYGNLKWQFLRTWSNICFLPWQWNCMLQKGGIKYICYNWSQVVPKVMKEPVRVIIRAWGSPLNIKYYYYMPLSHKDWELPNSWIWLAETDIDRGLDFPI